ncbi:MAG TPA: sugar ABC transporter permease [Clostridiaceae bacterium]|nr:sugar ABC transporter permease [Clostridiaceae bacterium]
MRGLRHKRYSSYTDRWRIKGLMFALPAIIILLCFIFYPLVLNIGYCFTNFDGINRNAAFVGLKNFRDIFSDRNFFLVIKNTFILGIIYVLGLNILALLLSVLLTKVGRIFSNVTKSILYFPCLLSPVIVGFVWRLIYDSRKGLLNQTLRFLGLNSLAKDWLGNISLVLPSVAATIIWFAVGYYIVIYYAGLVSIPTELYEASTVEGANGWQEFWHITLPLLAPSITINIVLTTISILSTFDLPYTITAGGGPGYYGTTLSIMIYTTAYEYMQSGKAFALATVLAVIAMTIALIELKILLKREEAING